MPARNRLKSVAHSIAHHAMSGLSYLGPELDESCIRAGLNCVAIEFVSEIPNTKLHPLNKRFKGRLGALAGKLNSILRTEGFELNDLRVAKLVLHMPADGKNLFFRVCYVALEDANGNVYEDWVEVSGVRLFLKEGASKKSREFTVKLNDQSLNAPILYAKEPPRRHACLRFPECGCYWIAATFAILAIINLLKLATDLGNWISETY